METIYQNKPKEYYSSERTLLMPFVPEHLTSVLDVGCSEGRFGKSLKESKGVREVWGIEYFHDSIAKAKENLDRVIESKIEDAIGLLPDMYFDCIFFNDVLEHLLDPYAVLSDIKIKCKKNGWVMASIPNILHYETMYQIIRTQDWEYSDYGILDKTHIRFFTRKSIQRMFDQAGYTVESITGINAYYGKKFAIVNFLLLNRLDAMKYIQFVVKARPK